MSAHTQGQWTQPYCGVQHLEGLKPGYQVTATHWGDWSEVFILVPGGGFRAARQETRHGDGASVAALVLGEQMARDLGALGAES